MERLFQDRREAGQQLGRSLVERGYLVEGLLILFLSQPLYGRGCGSDTPARQLLPRAYPPPPTTANRGANAAGTGTSAAAPHWTRVTAPLSARTNHSAVPG
jgi:hypothetical protein